MRLKPLIVAMLLLLLPAASWAADSGAQRDIRAFLTSVYSHYKGNDPSYDPTGKMAPRLFTAQLAVLMRETEELAGKKGDSVIDSDPFCDCQDTAGLRYQIGAIDVAGPADADTTVTLRFPDSTKPIPLRYVFKKERGKWLVQDIVTNGGKDSLLAYLRDENKRLKAEK